MPAPSNDWAPLNDAAKRLRCKDGRTISTATLARWANKGVGGHRLPSIRLNGRKLISVSAAKWFVTNADSRRDRSRLLPADRPLRNSVRIEPGLNPYPKGLKDTPNA